MRHAIGLIAQVTVTPSTDGMPGGDLVQRLLNWGQMVALWGSLAAILAACRQPISVAEVAARIDVPLGVAQILVGDLADAGLVRVHEATPSATPALLLRMIDAVRAL